MNAFRRDGGIPPESTLCFLLVWRSNNVCR